MTLIQRSTPKRADADIAIDFGTANTRIYVRGSGISFDEPSLCCFSDETWQPRLVAVGEAARHMVDRTSGPLRIARPLTRGVLHDIEAGREMLRHAVDTSIGRRRLRSPRALVGVPADATAAERTALAATASDAGIRVVRLVDEPLAAAFGAELPMDEPEGSMLIECGAGTTEVVVLSLGALCVQRSVRIGGHALDQTITDYLHSKHKFLIGKETAERVKMEIAARFVSDDAKTIDLELKGHNVLSGGPAVLKINEREIMGVIDRHAAIVVEVVRDVLNHTPPELSRDIHDRGIVLSGGGASVLLLQHAITQETGLRIQLAKEPLRCVSKGLGVILS